MNKKELFGCGARLAEIPVIGSMVCIGLYVADVIRGNGNSSRKPKNSEAVIGDEKIVSEECRL